MLYKVFFVEDEVVTREGIRDNVDWKASGFELCGEAADGEMALPLLRAAKPDALITDIKMPFMDGLQLSKVVRERMPWVKIIILSGHDEFEYAQQAIKLGVTDYLLKPVTVQTLQSALQSLAARLDEERKERENLKRLQEEVEENRFALRERLLFNLMVGALSPTEAIEKGQALGLDLVARHYLVIVLKFELADRSEQYDYDEVKRLQRAAAEIAEKNPDIFLLKRDWGDLLLIVKGNTPEHLREEYEMFLTEVERAASGGRYQVAAGVGTPKQRIADVSQSFAEALAHIQNGKGGGEFAFGQPIEQSGLLKADKLAVENYLRSGSKAGFDEFFDAHLLPLGEAVLKSNLIKNYVFMDVALAVARLASEIGGEAGEAVPELKSLETITSDIKTIEQLREQLRRILCGALAYRDSRANAQYKSLVRRAQEYIERRYTDPELSLNEVAACVNLSASHFSVIFSQETGKTFKEYLIECRIQKAKELLRMTSLRSADIAYQVGYSDPHYFSSVFKKNTGLTPMEFRSRI
ncbi:MAG: response regulator [Chloroflexi bacterium]|nr:response regulator [Chloroflexota bacterium]